MCVHWEMTVLMCQSFYFQTPTTKLFLFLSGNERHVDQNTEPHACVGKPSGANLVHHGRHFRLLSAESTKVWLSSLLPWRSANQIRVLFQLGLLYWYMYCLALWTGDLSDLLSAVQDVSDDDSLSDIVAANMTEDVTEEDLKDEEIANSSLNDVNESNLFFIILKPKENHFCW